MELQQQTTWENLCDVLQIPKDDSDEDTLQAIQIEQTST